MNRLVWPAFVAMSIGVALPCPARGFQAPATPPELVATTEAKTPEEERASFRLPPGFVAQLVASEPDIAKPMNLAFDARGRLWVTHSLEYPYPAAAEPTPRDKVTILSDFGPDGRARKVVHFAEKLNIPIGILPDPDGQSALVYSIPSIDRFTDKDGDGRADQRVPQYTTFGYRDTHGMASAFTWGFDGWIYACHGFANDSTVKGTDGQVVRMNSGNTYRIRRDGAAIEQRTWGQVNPFGLAFDPRGFLYSCDCHSKPLYQLIPGAYYPSFGKPHDGLGYGPEMCMHDHYSTGIAGVLYYAADDFPKEYRGRMFVGNVVTSRINQDAIEWRGSSPRAVEQPDFLISEDPWFRPVDLELGPDGAVYVADFYNRIIGHYEVPLEHPGRDRERGRIWRIVYRGSEPSRDAKGVGKDWWQASLGELALALDHPNLAVRTIATNVLADRGGETAREAARLMWKWGQAEARVHALWLLERTGGLEEATWLEALESKEALPRIHAYRIAGNRVEWTQAMRERVIAGLRDADAFARRAAAEALAAHADRGAIPSLLAAIAQADSTDDHLIHALRIALRNQLKLPESWNLARWNSWTDADRARLAEVALGVPTAEAAAYLAEHVRVYPVSDESLPQVMHHVARWGEDADRAQLVRFWRGRLGVVSSALVLREWFRGLQERGALLEGPAREWAVATAQPLCNSMQSHDLHAGIELVESVGLNEFTPRLVELAMKRTGMGESVRLSACNALAAVDGVGAISALETVLKDANESTGMRERSALLLSRQAGGNERARQALIDVAAVAEGRLQTMLSAGLAASPAGANALLAAIESGKVSPRLLQQREVRIWLDQQNVPDRAGRVERLMVNLVPADVKLQSLIDTRREVLASRPGNTDEGSRVFQTECALCHQMGGRGAKVGPQLDGIGARGLGRLLEDVLDPNRNVDQAFRSMVLSLQSGRVASGLLLREEGDVLVIADNQGKEQRYRTDEVEEKKLSSVSPMPADFGEKLSERQLADLMAYLLKSTAAPAPATEAARR